jgi:hypothetical protein
MITTTTIIIFNINTINYNKNNNIFYFNTFNYNKNNNIKNSNTFIAQIIIFRNLRPKNLGSDAGPKRIGF